MFRCQCHTPLLVACHELRNPLHAILAMLSFLVEDDGLSRSQRQDVSAIQLCAFNMQRLVNDVLDLAKLREGTLVLRPVQVCCGVDHGV